MNTSQDMFEDSVPEDSDIQVSNSTEACWRGVALSEIQARRPTNHIPVRPSSTHQVLFKVPVEPGQRPIPYPFNKPPVDSWDADHVRMPHSPHNLFPISQSELRSRWGLIKEALGKPIRSSKDLETAIFTYNLRSQQKSSLEALHEFFSETLSQEEGDYFFSKVLPGIVKLALEVEDAFRVGLKLLNQHKSLSISMSQEQAAILLANAFLCTFPRRPGPNKYPSINFMRLFQCGSMPSIQEKLKCFVNYFRRICKKRPTGVVTYSRRYVDYCSLPTWPELVDLPLPQLYVSSEGTIEKEGSGLLEIDFANKMVGGGVLGRGSVQEEIKFLICPELVVARLFTEALDDTEALIVIGCEQYNLYEGYGSSFTWSGNMSDERERDEWGRCSLAVAAIDATKFSDPIFQYRRNSLLRELNKAYAGFSGGRGGGVATGNWGCGVFRGDSHLKALLQLMAAAAAEVSLAYFTFGDIQLCDDIYKTWLFLKDNKITVGRLWKLLGKYCDTRAAQPLYDFLISSVSSDAAISNELNCLKDLWRREGDGECSLKRGTKKTGEVSGSSRNFSSGNEETTEDKTSSGKVDEDSGQGASCEDGVASQKTRPEPLPGKTCLLNSRQGRVECLSAEKARWDAYRTAIRSYSASKPPLKRKISDYFQKADK